MKDFQGWNEYQQHLEEKTKPLKPFLEGQVWRCAIGYNTGNEIDGKSRRYWRPVIVLRKFYDELFIGVPLTRSPRGQDYHLPLEFKGQKSYAVVNQLRAMDPRRLQQHLGTLTGTDFERVRQAVQELFETN